MNLLSPSHWKVVEDADEDQAQQRDTHIVVPADTVGGQACIDCVIEAAVIGGLYRRWRHLRMSVKRRVEASRGSSGRRSVVHSGGGRQLVWWKRDHRPPSAKAEAWYYAHQQAGAAHRSRGVSKTRD